MSDQKVPNGGQTAGQNPSEELVPKKEESFLDSTMFRLMTVGMYMCGVGGMGFLLSVFYLFLWDSRMPIIEYTRT